MEIDSPSFHFKPKASFPRYSLVLIFDIEGFSNFFSQPDVEHFVPRFLNHTFRFVASAIDGGPAPHAPGGSESVLANDWAALPGPVHSKFMGDGALYIWEIGKDAHGMKAFQIQELFSRLSILRKAFPKYVDQWSEDIPLTNLPFNIRFGLSAGTVYRLNYAYHARSEYMGYAINLASRLQKYCPEIGFIASARVEIPSDLLKKLGYIKLVARKLKGFPREVVIVRESTYENLSKDRQQELFIDPRMEKAPGVPELQWVQ
jgi:class 3 adenylate cyclase